MESLEAFTGGPQSVYVFFSLISHIFNARKALELISCSLLQRAACISAIVFVYVSVTFALCSELATNCTIHIVFLLAAGMQLGIQKRFTQQNPMLSMLLKAVGSSWLFSCLNGGSTCISFRFPSNSLSCEPVRRILLLGLLTI